VTVVAKGTEAGIAGGILVVAEAVSTNFAVQSFALAPPH